MSDTPSRAKGQAGRAGNGSRPTPPTAAAQAARQARLAGALRENLRRRKAQSRARGPAAADPASDDD